MQAQQFIDEHGIKATATHVTDFPMTTTYGTTQRRRFEVTFTYPGPAGADHGATFPYETSVHETADGLDFAEALYVIATSARYGDTYEDLIDEFGQDCAITREQWETGEHATRLRCRAWLPDDTAWEQFLTIEYDDSDTAPGGR